MTPNLSPDLAACLYSFFRNWPQFNPDSPDYDTDVNGAGLVDWLSEQTPYWLDALKKSGVDVNNPEAIV